jgi:hypothetical protein
MKKHFNSIIAIGVLVFIAMACNASFTTANISSFNFGKNESANPPTTTFDIADKIYAVTVVSNTSAKHKMKFKVTYENVSGKNKGEEFASKDIDFEAARPVFLYFNVPLPGEYKVDAVLVAEDGKELDKKSGTITVKGTAPASTTSDDSKDSDDN